MSYEELEKLAKEKYVTRLGFCIFEDEMRANGCEAYFIDSEGITRIEQACEIGVGVGSSIPEEIRQAARLLALERICQQKLTRQARTVRIHAAQRHIAVDDQKRGGPEYECAYRVDARQKAMEDKHAKLVQMRQEWNHF